MTGFEDATLGKRFPVRVTKLEDGNETIPARYNTHTTLGEEVARNAANISSGMIRFELTSP